MIVQLIVTSGHKTGQVIPVSTEKFVIGRAMDCHLKPTSELISRYHCTILVGDDVIVRDLGSRNGVRVNGERISADQKVKHGDKLGVGPLEFYIRITADADGAATPPTSDLDVSWIQRPTAGGGPDETQPPTLVQNPASSNEGEKTIE